MGKLTGKRILIMATDGFEESELFGPRDLLREAGAEVVLASPTRTPIQATVMDDPGKTIRPELAIDEVSAEEYDALVLPGGVRNPDSLRLHDGAIALIRAFNSAKKPIAAICHGPWLLAEADIVRGRKVACWPSIATDLRNAGAQVVNQAAVLDGNIITSREPDDVLALTEALAGLLTASP